MDLKNCYPLNALLVAAIGWSGVVCSVIAADADTPIATQEESPQELIENGSFTEKDGSEPEGWRLRWTDVKQMKFKVDRKNYVSEPGALVVELRDPGYAIVDQRLPNELKLVKFTGSYRVEGEIEEAYIAVQYFEDDEVTEVHEGWTTIVTATDGPEEWTKFEKTVKMLEHYDICYINIFLKGEGELQVDDFSAVEVSDGTLK